jgi:hypothetical protein
MSSSADIFIVNRNRQRDLPSFSVGVLDGSEGRALCRSDAGFWIDLVSSLSRRYCAHGIGAAVTAINEHLLVFRCTFGDVKCG